MKTTDRPIDVRQLSERSDSKERFGYEMADFEHELTRMTSRGELFEAIREEPMNLAGRFQEGVIADAWLAAVAELLSVHYRIDDPDWIWNPTRFLDEPVIHDSHSTRLKIWHVLKCPPAFSRRNYFVDYQLPPIELRPGRPRKSEAHKRLMNRRRVARHRANRKLILAE
jgi:hypothetical protein